MSSWRRFLQTVSLVGVLASSFLVQAARAEVARPSLDEIGSLIVTAETTEVREGPSRGSAVITIVGQGEIFAKEGRTGAWYYIRINGDAFGWVNGRDVSRYQAGETPVPYAGPEEETVPYLGPDVGRPYPYYPGYYYDYSYYAWGQPYLSWEWYFYGGDSHRYRTWDHDRSYARERDHDRSRDDGWRTDEHRSRDDDRYRNDDSHRGRSGGRRFVPAPRPFGPRIRPPFPRR